MLRRLRRHNLRNAMDQQRRLGRHYGVGQQMCALEVIQANLIQQSAAPVTHTTPGSSQGNASLGTTDGNADGNPIVYAPVTMADKAGAVILTLITVVGAIGGGYFVVS